MSTKNVRLPADQIRELVAAGGACFASDRITVDGVKVGFMYREEPDFAEDSGWRFFGGDESQAYTDDAENFGVYEVNTVANYDPEIIPFLELPAGAVLARDDASGELVQIDEAGGCEHDDCNCEEEGELTTVSGTLALNDHWSLALTGEFEQQVDDGELVLEGQGLSLYCNIWEQNPDQSSAETLAEIKKRLPPTACKMREFSRGQVLCLAFHMPENEPEGEEQAVCSLFFAPQGYLQITIFYDDETDLPRVEELLAGVEYSA